jgi:prepilin-type N-terminal cleavage/methylation domain-containing protein
MNTRMWRTGFTLIEVLVAVSIISILAAIIYPNLNEARDEARNKAFQVELKETQLAIELYKAQNDGDYPDAATPGGTCDGGNAQYSYVINSPSCPDALYINGMVDDFISELPNYEDSANDDCEIRYMVASDNSWFKLTAEQCHSGADTAAEGIQLGDELARCLEDPICSGCDSLYEANPLFYRSYAIYSAGGECR